MIAIAKYAESPELKDSSLIKLKETATGCLWEFANADAAELPDEVNNEPVKKFDGSQSVVEKPIDKTAFITAIKQMRAAQLKKQADVLKKQETPQGQKQSGHVMISYSWATKELVMKVTNEVRNLGLNIWLDIEQMHDSIDDRMAEAVEGASVVLMCYSDAYKKSSNCKSEAEYAHKRAKNIIPVLCQEHYDADGWLGFLLGRSLYYDVSSPEKLQQNLPALLKALSRQMDSGNKAIEIVAPSVTSAFKPEQSEEYLQWDEAEVNKWLEEKNLAHFKEMYEY